MPVSDKHKLYKDHEDKWQLVRDCIKGSLAVKSARQFTEDSGGANPSNTLYNLKGSKYLPVPNPEDTSLENQARYKSYRLRASFVNFTGHTKDGLLGMATKNQPVIELEPNLEYMEDNATGSGQGITDLYQRTLSEVLEVGRYGLLVDFPESDGGTTLAETADKQCFIKCYPCESIVNWRTDTINGKEKLILVVLAEEVYDYGDDGYGCEVEIHHRVLFLDENGNYTQQMYNADDEPYGDPIIPRNYSGQMWKEIPFQFVGTIDNNPCPDNSVLYDLAEINIAHYRNSADFEESCFMVGQPTPVLSGLSQAWLEDVMQGAVQIGSRSAIVLPEGGNATLLQAGSNQMPENGMKIKEEQMIKIGAKIITDRGGNETAEGARMRFAGQSSKLATIINNIEKAFDNLLWWCAEFMGGSGESTIEFSKDFYDASANPQMIMASIQLLDRGVIAKSDLRSNLKEMDILNPDRTDEDIDVELETSNPLGGI